MKYFRLTVSNLCSVLIICQLVNYSHQNWLGDVFAKASKLVMPLFKEHALSNDPNDVEFHLFPSREDVTYNQTLIFGDVKSIKKSSFNISRPLTVIVPGFLADPEAKAFVFIKNAYLKKGTEVNIVQVNWTKLSKAISIIPAIYYKEAVDNVVLVGKRLSDFLIFLMKNKFIKDPSEVHIVGFSLGAHIAGFAGTYFNETTNTLLGRISGLDPANPDFKFRSPLDRLDSSDAKFVDITHTNQGEFGFIGDLGHVDFYANGGGPNQPDCPFFKRYFGTCSHSDAYKYYAESITTEILACNCANVTDKVAASGAITAGGYCDKPVIYGEECSPKARGEYCLHIRSDD